jgi:hypothetical protein
MRVLAYKFRTATRPTLMLKLPAYTTTYRATFTMLLPGTRY